MGKSSSKLGWKETAVIEHMCSTNKTKYLDEYMLENNIRLTNRLNSGKSVAEVALKTDW